MLSVLPDAVAALDEGEGTRLIRVDLELGVLAGDVETGASDFFMLGTDGTRDAPTAAFDRARSGVVPHSGAGGSVTSPVRG